MTPDEAIGRARSGRLEPVFLVVGDERLLRDRVVDEIRKAALEGGVPAFNEDRFTAGEGAVEVVLAAARTVPMMSRRRFVLVRGAERWDTGESTAAFDALAEYAAGPVDSTCLLITGSKIDGRRKLVQLARRKGFLVSCDPVDERALPGWIVDRFTAKGHPIERSVAELLAALASSDLSSIDDAVERLSLYAGPGRPIDEASVSACVARVAAADTWALVDAVGARDLARGLQTLADTYDPRDRGLPLLGALSWSVRQLARYQAAVESGSPPEQAASKAGAFQPGRARELAAKAKAIRSGEVERWLLILAETDLALKSSRRPADAILEDMLTRLCRAEIRASSRTRPI